jgi:hypothetical protein
MQLQVFLFVYGNPDYSAYPKTHAQSGKGKVVTVLN